VISSSIYRASLIDKKFAKLANGDALLGDALVLK
jgi:hypothetical protein